MSTIPLSYLSICHTNTCQTVKYTLLVNVWYSSGAMMFARLSVSCRYTLTDCAYNEAGIQHDVGIVS